MAPLSAFYPKLPSPRPALFPTLHKRSSDCSAYDGSCDDTHHFIFLVIILLLGFFFSLLFTFAYFRGRRARMLVEMQTRMQRDQMNLRDRAKPLEGTEWQTPPPPYMPTRPESVARRGR